MRSRSPATASLLPPAFRFGLWVAGINVLAYFALRLAFLVAHSSLASAAPFTDLLHALYIGLKFDIRLALLATAPYLLFAAIPWLNPSCRPLAIRAWLSYFTAVAAIALFVYFIDFAHYGYTRTRVNATLFEHLLPLDVALRMAWESYPVAWVLLGLGLLTAGYVQALRYLAHRTLAAPAEGAAARWRRAVAIVGAASVLVLGVFGKWSWYPLRWSDAYFSHNEFVSSLALNPVLFLFDTRHNLSRPFDVDLVRANYDTVARLLGMERRDAVRLSFERYVEPAANRPERRPNLVVIHLESFAAFKVGVFGNQLDATPRFDAIARQGILFDNFFVPAVPTARAVFSMVTGIPDYSPGGSASRNPLVVRQHTLINALTGYERFYFLGGSASWGNIRGLLTQSVDDLKIYEEGDYDAGRIDTWGVSDHDLFRTAHGVLKDRRGPVFAFIQTSGNHRPYTLPAVNPEGFEPVRIERKVLQAHGFDDVAAYNSLRLLDHALGHFLDLARRERYFNDTIFVLYGDHGNPAANDIPYERLGLTGYHVPMVIYAPGQHQQGRRVSAVASLADLLPTALSLMGIPHLNTGLGRDLFAPRPADERFAVLPDGLLTEKYLLRLHPRRVQLYRYRSETPTEDVSRMQPAKAAELQRLHAALVETSRYLLHHNRPRLHAPP